MDANQNQGVSVSSGKSVALCMGDPDIRDIFQYNLQNEGNTVMGLDLRSAQSGKLSLPDFFKTHRPEVVFWSIEPPYEKSWEYFQNIRRLPQVGQTRFVIVTTDENAVRKLMEEQTEGNEKTEIIPLPFERIEDIFKALKDKPSEDEEIRVRGEREL